LIKYLLELGEVLGALFVLRVSTMVAHLLREVVVSCVLADREDLWWL
jgi:hypothetical protein